DASPPTDTLGHVTPGGSPEGCSTIGTRTERSYPHDRCLRLPVCASVRSPGGRRPVAPVRTDVGDGLVDEPGREDVDIQPPQGRPMALWLGRIHRQGRGAYLAAPCARRFDVGAGQSHAGITGACRGGQRLPAHLSPAAAAYRSAHPVEHPVV